MVSYMLRRIPKEVNFKEVFGYNRLSYGECKGFGVASGDFDE